MKIKFKDFGLLEFLVSLSFLYVVSMLIWTASTRSSVEARAQLIKENHTTVVNILNNQINKCDRDPELLTSWGEDCKNQWSSDKIVNFLIENADLKNPYSNEGSLIRMVNDPRIEAEGKAGQSTNKGIIFVSASNFLSEPGSEWIVGTCIKSPCVAAGNNELISIYR